MCGIVGYTHNGAETQPILLRMRELLRHRGPDEAGEYFTAQVALGHRRLSIVDLVGGQQPMSDASGDLTVVYNGEIYNHHELRRQLGEELFRTDCDTEVLLHAYRRWGVDCLQHFNGMFAFALYDRGRRQLFLARDRMGQKPLYYTRDPQGELLFASEPKALFGHPAVEKQLSRKGLETYLRNDYLPVPESIYAGINKLAGGEYLLFNLQSRELQRRCYWETRFEPLSKDENSLATELLERLETAVERRLMADVPLGIFLSGGIDSSTIAALACCRRPAKQIKTFSISFAERSFDESYYARQVADFLGTDHHVCELTAARLLEILPEAIASLDEPFADPSYLPTLLLCRFTRQQVTVALGGDGADELFAGYPTYLPFLLTGRLQLPQRLVTGLQQVAQHLPVKHDYLSFEYKLKRFLRGLAGAGYDKISDWQGGFSNFDLDALLIERVAERPVAEFANIFAYYQRTYLQEDILYKVDRASMACSLEVRAPFLDVEFVEFANNLPQSCKLRGLQGKRLLRKAVSKLLPGEIIERPKKGFGIPLAEWFCGPLRDDLQQTLDREQIEGQGLFRWSAVERLLTDLFSRRRNTAKELWSLYVFQKWYTAEFFR